MASDNFYEENLALVNAFTQEPANFPYLFPEDRVNYYRHQLILPHQLPPSIRPRCYQICWEILRHWYPFQDLLHNYTSAILRLDTTLPIDGLNVLASPLSIMSASIAAAGKTLKQFAPLIFFCHEKLPGTDRRATPLEVVTSLTAQLMSFITNYPRHIDLKSLTSGPQNPYPRAKTSLFHGLAFLKCLLLALPRNDTVHIILDRVSSLRATPNETHGFLRDMIRLVEETRSHMWVKLVLTGTMYYPDDLGQDDIDYDWKVFKPEDSSDRDSEMIPIDTFRSMIEGLLSGHGEEHGPHPYHPGISPRRRRCDRVW